MKETLHFVGIGGIGMSAIARVLMARGVTVTGSDAYDSSTLSELRKAGAAISVGHRAANVNGAQAVVISSAIDSANPEVAGALERGIPVIRRGEMLAKMMQGQQGIAICGTHGKTTTTGMIAHILRRCGVDASVVLGGIDVETGTNAHDGSSPYFLTEADESDGSFALLSPHVAVVTNIENDHLSRDEDLRELVSAFESFLTKLPQDGCAIVGVDNEHSASIAWRSRPARTVTFAAGADADVHASSIQLEGLGSTFDVIAGGVCLGNVALNVPGVMNVQNALGALCVARELDVPFAQMAAALTAFKGVRRRFEILAKTPRMVVVDDYAHHPTAVRHTIAAARTYHHGPIVAAFQPHRYSRTAYLARDFAAALAAADEVYLAPVYSASEPAIEGVSERNIGEPLAAAGKRVTYAKYVHDLRPMLMESAPHGALVLMLGAGNITKVAADLARDAERTR